MGVKSIVFGSKKEQENFYKLSEVWGADYRIYHNLPFLNIFTVENLFDWSQLQIVSVTEVEIGRLKKTSVDYTLCDHDDTPILCIEFDGLQEGHNVGGNYHPIYRSKQSSPEWRKEITELKLRVARCNLFPFFVVGSEHFRDVSKDTKITIVDGIIGYVLASKAARKKIGQGFKPEEVGYSEEEFVNLPSDLKEDLITNWVHDVEIYAEVDHDPFLPRIDELRTSLGITHNKCQWLHYPDASVGKTADERHKLFWDAESTGTRFTCITADLGEVTRLLQ